MLDGLRGECSIAELCRREGIAESLYYSWSKEFLEAGKRRLAGDTARAATSSEVTDLRREAWQTAAGAGNVSSVLISTISTEKRIPSHLRTERRDVHQACGREDRQTAGISDRRHGLRQPAHGPTADVAEAFGQVLRYPVRCV